MGCLDRLPAFPSDGYDNELRAEQIEVGDQAPRGPDTWQSDLLRLRCVQGHYFSLCAARDQMMPPEFATRLARASLVHLLPCKRVAHAAHCMMPCEQTQLVACSSYCS